MQIGPKLRSKKLKKLENGAKHVVSTNVRGLGRTAEKYGAPITAGILALTGAGIPLSAAIMAAESGGASLAAGHNLKHTLGKAAVGGAEGAVAGGVGKLVHGAGSALSHIPGVSSLASHFGGNAAGSAAQSALGGGIDDVANAGLSSVGSGALGSAVGSAGSSGIMGSLGGLAKDAGGFLMGNGGKNALGVAQGINTVLQQKKANDLANRALGSAEGAYNDRAPLRQAGMQGMLKPQAPSLVALNQSGANPYAQKPQAPGVVPAGY